MSTELAFLHDAYARTVDTVVSHVETGEDRRVRVALERTLFYPTGGGQPHDTGVLRWDGGSARVTEVRKQGDEVWHTLEGDGPDSRLGAHPWAPRCTARSTGSAATS